MGASYLPVVDVLERLAAEGRRDLLTLGVTPVLAAQLDDPYCLREFHTWLGFWQHARRRAGQLGATRTCASSAARASSARASDALETFEARLAPRRLARPAPAR